MSNTKYTSFAHGDGMSFESSEGKMWMDQKFKVQMCSIKIDPFIIFFFLIHVGGLLHAKDIGRKTNKQNKIVYDMKTLSWHFLI